MSKSRKIVIKANDYKYPSISERKSALKDFPRIEVFNIVYKSDLEYIINNGLQTRTGLNYHNLYWWNNCLTNRIGSLKESYIYTISNYNRGFKDNINECEEKDIINKILFTYYAEIFYYYYFSTRDVIGQIVNIFYCMEFSEDNLYFNTRFIEQVPNKDVRNILLDFFEKSAEASNYRNKFAHKFTPLNPDYRSIINLKSDGRQSLEWGTGFYIESKTIVENINFSIQALSNLILSLKRYINLEDKRPSS